MAHGRMGRNRSSVLPHWRKLGRSIYEAKILVAVPTGPDLLTEYLWTGAQMTEPFTLRMAAHELIGEKATDALLKTHSPEWLAYVLISHIEANDVHTTTAEILRDWHDRRMKDRL